MNEPAIAPISVPADFTSAGWFHWCIWLFILLLLYWHLRQELTAARTLTLFESEGSLSIRLVLAAAWSVCVMLLLFYKHIDVDGAMKLMYFPEILLITGAAKIVGSRWAERPVGTTHVKAESAQVDAQGDVNFQTPKDPE